MKHYLRPALSLHYLRGNLRADNDLVRSGSVHTAHHPRPFFQIYKNHVVRLLRRLRVNDRHRIHRAAAARLHPFQRLTLRAGKTRRKIAGAVDCITLDKEPAVRKGGTPTRLGRNYAVFGHARGIWRSRTNVNLAGVSYGVVR